MDDLRRLFIERACERLVTQYCHFVDHGQAGRIAELFTEDGVWTSPENTMTGREAIAHGFARRQANAARMSRHICENTLITVDDADQARGVCYLTLYRHDGAVERTTSPSDVPAIVGEYRDAFARTATGWRFKRREIVVSFVKA
jgi:uncharacterized protein (TIGR02246 family)